VLIRVHHTAGVDQFEPPALVRSEAMDALASDSRLIAHDSIGVAL
jgi:hypothetical protein